MNGIIPALSEQIVKIQYNALASGIFQADHYLFETPGGSRTTLTCTGQCMPPVVTLRKENLEMPGSLDFHSGAPGNSLNFRDVELGHKSTRVFFFGKATFSPHSPLPQERQPTEG